MPTKSQSQSQPEPELARVSLSQPKPEPARAGQSQPEPTRASQIVCDCDRYLLGSLGTLLGFLGALWGSLGALLGSVGAPSGSLGHSWVCLGASKLPRLPWLPGFLSFQAFRLPQNVCDRQLVFVSFVVGSCLVDSFLDPPSERNRKS